MSLIVLSIPVQVCAAAAETPAGDFMADPALLDANEPEVAPPAEAAAGSFTADEKTPQNLRATASGMEVELKWDKFEKDGFYYNVYRSTAEAGNFIVINKELLVKNSFTDSAKNSLYPPKHNTRYFYKVTATDSQNETGDSNMAEARPSGPLMPPSNISTVARDTSILLRWAEPVSSGPNMVSAYNIFRGLDTAGGNQVTITPATVWEFNDTADGAGLTKGVKYFYWMQSVDSTGLTSPLSDPVSAKPFSGISAPRNVTVTSASSESIKIMWDEPETQGTYGLRGYKIYRSTDPAAFPADAVNESLVRIYPDEKGRMFYYDNIINSTSAPAPGIQYYYKVVPIDADGNTGASNTAVAAKIEYFKFEKSGILSADISEYGLPPDSKLKLAGRKLITVELSTTIWDNPKILGKEPGKIKPDIKQPLTLDLKGNIGSKIYVDIKYDDSELAMSSFEDKKISIQYKGDKDETLQELSFGDINFDMPATRYVRPLASLFGIKGKASFLDNKLKLSGAWAQTKGITDIQEFRGTMRQMLTNGSPGVTINDTNFIANTYYYLTKDITKVTALNPLHDLPVDQPDISVEPGSVRVYVDDQYAPSDNLNTVITASGNYHFDRKELGSDYTVDYKNGVVKFNFTVNNTHIIAVAYRLTNGEAVGYDPAGNFDFTEANFISAPDGMTTNSARLIKGNGNDVSHMVMNYYYMGASQINSPNTDPAFDLKIYKTNVDQSVPLPSQANAFMYYEIDSNFGIIKFKNFYPFKLNSTGIIYSGPSVSTGNDLDAYNVNRASAVSLYKMVFKYNYSISSYRLDFSPVVANSERVFINGELQKKDKDYQIIYETGDIVFLDTNRIGSTSAVKVVYEYSPFIQTFESTVVGARLDYDMLDNLKLGATYIRKDSTKPTEAPDARSTELSLSTPYGGYVWDANVSFNIKKENINFILSSLPLLGKFDLPLDLKFDAEVAGSDLNLNTYDWKTEKGIAVIDDLEGADNERGMSMIDTAWFPASYPLGKVPVNRVFTVRSSYEGQGHEKIQTISQGYAPSVQKILRVRYDGLTDQKWDALRQNISAAGENMHNYSFLEMWVKVRTNKPIRMSVDIGIISEDSNYNSAFLYNSLSPLKLNDSEDTLIQNKPSGRLENGENIGISPGYYAGYPGSTAAYWGAGNSNTLPDTEDMNNNGSLDTGEKFYRYSAEAASGYIGHPELEFSDRDEWVNIRIPLNQVSDSSGLSVQERDIKNTQFLAMIKHIRISFAGAGSSASSGTVEIESIKFIGNSWMLAVPNPATYIIYDGAGNRIDSPDLAKFDAVTVKKSTESSYVPNLSLYRWQTESEKNLEEALKIKYSLSGYDIWGGNKPIYYVRKPFNASFGYDYRPYKYLKMDVFYKTRDASAGPGRTMFIRLGQDGADENRNFYQYNEMLDTITPGVWQTVVFRIDGSDKKRSDPIDTPNLRQINMVTIGFINPNTQAATEEFYINNIRLTDPEPKQGMAKYTSSSLNFAGVGTLTHEFEDKETDFNSIEDLTKSQMRRHESVNRVRFTPSFLPFLSGFTSAYSRTQSYIEDKYKDDLSYTANQSVPDTDVESYESIFGLNQILGFTAGSNIRFIRQKDIFYGVRSATSNRTDRLVWQPNASWTAPKEFFFIPLGSNRIESNYELNSYKTDYLGNTNVVYYDSWKMTLRQRYRWEGGYDFWKISITPVYEYVLEEGKGNMAGYDYYKYALSTDGLNYSPEYLVLKRDIMPSLNIRLNDAWIFSPVIAYSTTYRHDYGSSMLYTTGRLEAYSGLALSQLLNFLPNISRYRFSIDLNETYDNKYDTAAFRKFEALTFERRWNAFLWKMLYDENEIRMLENISLRGTVGISHELSLDNINIADVVSFGPRWTFSKYRDSQGRTSQDPREQWSINFGNIQVKKITIPFLEFLVKDKTMSGGYSFTKDTTYSELGTVKTPKGDVLRESGTHNGNLSLYFGLENGSLNGNISYNIAKTDSSYEEDKSWSLSMTPSFAMTYILKKEEPLTVWDWVPGIGGKVFKFEQNLNLSLNASLAFIQSKTSTTPLNSKAVFTTALAGDYNVLQNLKASAKITYVRTSDIIKNNSNHTIAISVGGDLSF